MQALRKIKRKEVRTKKNKKKGCKDSERKKDRM